jgi:hypothetical protein
MGLNLLALWALGALILGWSGARKRSAAGRADGGRSIILKQSDRPDVGIG